MDDPLLAKEISLGVFVYREIQVLQVGAAQEIPRLVAQSPGQGHVKHGFVEPVTWTVSDHRGTVERRVQIRPIVCGARGRGIV